jgi:alpha-tubulin N-acetyltransferase 1
MTNFVIIKLLFEKMLANEKVSPHKLGYDRPSEKLIAFLSRHYSLKQFVP